MFIPGEEHLGEQEIFLYNPQNNNLNYNVVADKTWEVFGYFMRVYKWDAFVYLYLVVWNFEPDCSFIDSELFLIEKYLSSLHSSGASSKEKIVATDEIIEQFKKYRNTKNEALRNEIMTKVYNHLTFHMEGQQILGIDHLLYSMSSLQKRTLRNIFISRIVGYSKFVDYLSKEWKNKPTGETDDNNQLLMKENQAQKIETDLKQFLNINNQNEKTYDGVRIEKNIIDKPEETISNSLINEVNSEIVKPVLDSKEFVKTEEPARKKMEFMDNVEIKKKEESPEFVSDENLTKKKEIENETINKGVKDNIEINKDDKDDNIETNKDDKDDNFETNNDDKEENIGANKDDKDETNDDKEVNIESNKDDKDKEDNIEVNASENNSKDKIRTGKKSYKSSQHRDNSYKRNSIKVEKLQQEIEVLRQEAAKHQAALGGILNVGWRDDDSNNSVQLTKDIEKLQKDLADFTRVKRGGIKINNDAVRILLEEFKCKTLVENKTNTKLVLSAALQRKLIFHTLNFVRDYFKRPINELGKASSITNDMLEAAIFSKTNQLIELIERFTKVNTGTDAHTQLLPIKIRQQVYASLGQRSFIDSNHPFIKDLIDKNLNGMKKYRTIDDDVKNKKTNSEAATIIRQILHLFYFRLHTQEPKPSIKFYQSGDKFDPSVMESVGQIKNDDDEDNDELEVEICSFPAVGLLENLDEEERRVFTKAQVIVRSKKSV